MREPRWGLPPTVDEGARQRGRPDRIELRGLRLLGTHGVLDEEQLRAQPFELDLDVALSTDEAAASDELSDTVDYAALVDAVAAVVGGTRSFRLLEALAAACAEAALDADGRALGVTVTVRKLRPPVAADLASAGVRVSRRRG